MNSIKAALVVQNCIAGNFEINFQSTLKLVNQAIAQKAEIIVFPEMNLTGYVSNEDIHDFSRPMTTDMQKSFIDIAKFSNITLLIGLAEKTRDKKIYPSHYIFYTDGSFDVYRKIHISPYEKSYFSAGNHISTYHSHGLTFGIQLCYDAHFPELSTAMALKQADIIFIPHASPRGSVKEKYNSWIRHLRARAFDNGVYIAATNQTGDNGKGLMFPGLCLFIGPDGNVIYSSLDGSESIHVVDIDRTALNNFRSHPMRYFLPHRRPDLFH